MTRIIYLLCFYFLVVTTGIIRAQYPNFFLYNNESGLPGNEVYSLTTDKKGFVWLGCDAGLYKFDGVRFYLYKSKKQRSRSVTGLCTGTNNIIFCYNFQSQLFFLDNDSLKEIPHSFNGISNICCDTKNNLYVNHKDGFAVYNWKNRNWSNYSNFGIDNKNSWKYITRSVSLSENNKVFFLTTSGIGLFDGNKVYDYENELLKNYGISKFLLAAKKDEVYITFTDKGNLYKFFKGQLIEIKDEELNKALSNKKITNIKVLQDNNLWICTYNGIFCYNFLHKKVKPYYEELSFSDCLIDREGNYWFSTLQTGVMRVNNLDQAVWNNLRNNRIEHLTGDSNTIFFTPSTKHIGQLNTKTNTLVYTDITGEKDIQCLNYNPYTKEVYFYTNENLYALNNQKTRVILKGCMPVKHILPVNNTHIISSSFGAYVYDCSNNTEIQKLHDSWSRQTLCNSNNDKLWVATNDGLKIYKKTTNYWEHSKTILPDNQIISIDINTDSFSIIAIVFNGEIYKVDENNNYSLLASLPHDAKPNSIKVKNQTVYVASNKGIWIYDLKSKTWDNLNSAYGIASNSVQEFLIIRDNLFLATKNGIQKIPADMRRNNIPAIIYLKNEQLFKNYIKLKHHEGLTLYPELSHYKSNGIFQYAYRINDNDWITLPSGIEKIEIQNIPPGEFTIKLKAIDFYGKNSVNSIEIKGYMSPPFWRSWWFILVLMSSLISILFFILKYNFNKRQLKLKQLNELNNSKLTALRSQMNPHFIFNSLNSIQDLILKGDVENSYSYLTSFSSMVRKILNYSDKDFIDFEQEIKLIELYLSLEKLRFKKDFHYNIKTNGIEDIQIPPMLIQPFIENSILHGLLHKEGEKILNITFTINEYLVCEIEDNGVGREKSKQIQERQLKSHKSFSGEAIKKRFAILSELLENNYGYFYSDLTPGTKVTLRIPFKRKF